MNDIANENNGDNYMINDKKIINPVSVQQKKYEACHMKTIH